MADKLGNQLGSQLTDLQAQLDSMKARHAREEKALETRIANLLTLKSKVQAIGLDEKTLTDLNDVLRTSGV